MSADLLTQLAEYGRYHEAEQLPVDIDEARLRGAVVRPLTTERPTEPDARGRWSGARVAVAAAVLILLAVGGAVWLLTAGDDPPVADESTATTVSATVATTLPAESLSDDPLATAQAYYAAFAADDIPAMVALFAPGAEPAQTVCYNTSGTVGVCPDVPEPRTLDQMARTEAWKRASGTEYRNVECSETDDADIVECTHDESHSILEQAPPVPTVQTFRIGTDGIITVDSVYGPPDFLLVHDQFTVWVARNHPEVRGVIDCCEWTSIDDARAEGERTAELEADWATYLDRIDCGFDDTACATTATLDGFIAAYNAGDIDVATSYFVEESQIMNHPVGGNLSGLDAIRTALEQHRAQAAEPAPYVTIDPIISGFTAAWDHTWVDSSGQQWCGSGSSFQTAGGRILGWTYGDEAPCE